MLTKADVIRCFDSRRLELILFPTERCNFRCTYCYEDFAVGRMRPAVVNGVKNLISRRAPQLDSLELTWFGGEPLLAMPIIEEISGQAAGAVSLNSGLRYTGNMTTNGYLLNHERLRRLTDLGIRRFQISLDGPADVHDRSRLRINGRGSFNEIWQNLLMARDSAMPFEILLRIHVTPETASTVPDLITSLSNHFSNDDRFRVWFKAVGRLGGPNDSEIPLFNPDGRRQVMTDLDEQATAAGLELMTNGPSTYICYAAQANSLAIRADGSIAKCTVALYDDRNRIGELYEDGTLSVDSSKLRPWLRGFGTQSEEDLACPMRAMGPNAEAQRQPRSIALPLIN